MPVVIRLRKTGTRKKIRHRIVVTDSRSPRDGRFIELLGYWDPNPDVPKMSLDVPRAKDWVSKGAQPSDTVYQIFKKAGVYKE